ncbi:hypothetical protein GCM10023092_12960 [Rurimicrobium arvi]|uniref:Glycine-rich domain-containing protein n=2 Tax=Rurimicrobium arvi TaxID=2049916 RepID=A0ABP8MQA1_9BACT
MQQLADRSNNLHISHEPIHDLNAPILIGFNDTLEKGVPGKTYILKSDISDSTGIPVEYLVVGAGGGGDGGRNARYYGGGGGGGEVVTGTVRLAGSVFVSCGAAGGRGGYFADSATRGWSGNPAYSGRDGSESVLGSIVALGGKGAFSNPDSSIAGVGGASGNANAGAFSVKASGAAGAGGGGAGGSASGINAGPGMLSSITGASVYYGAGGSSRRNPSTNGSTTSGRTAYGTSGVTGRGCGGGGGNSVTGQQFNGSSGGVIIAYPDTYPALAIGSSLSVSVLSTRSGFRVYWFSGGADTVSFPNPGKSLCIRPDTGVRLILANSGHYGGSTVVNTDTLFLGNGDSLGCLPGGTTDLRNNAVLVINKSRNTVMGSAITGTGSVWIRNKSFVSFRSAKPYTYTGVTRIDTGSTLVMAPVKTTSGPLGNIDVYGTLCINRADLWGSASTTSSAKITVFPGGTLYTNRSFCTIVNPVLAGGSVFMLGGVSASWKSLQIKGGLNVTENSVISADNVDGLSGMIFSSAPINVAAGKTLRVDSPAVFYGSGQFTKNGNGTLDLYLSLLTGNVTINAGTMITRNGGLNSFGIHSGTVTIAAGASLIYQLQPPWGSYPALRGNITGAGKFFQTVWGLTLKGNNAAFTGSFTSNGEVRFDTTLSAFSNSDSVAIAWVNLSSVGGGTYTFGDLNPGWGGVSSSVAGSHVLTFGGKNKSRIWATPVSDGTGTVSLFKRGTGTYTTTATNTYTGTTSIATGAFQIGNGGTSGMVGPGGIIDNAEVIFNRSDSVTVDNLISGTGKLTMKGTGTVNLRNANTYTGVTTVNAGTLTFSGSGKTAVPGSIIVNSGAVVRLDRNDTWGTADSTASCSLTLNSGATLRSNNSFNSLWGLVLNGGSVQCNGGANASLRSFQLSGTLSVTNNAAISDIGGSDNGIRIGGNGAPILTISVNSGKTLSIASTVMNSVNHSPNGINKTGTGTLLLIGSNTFSGPVTVTAGTIRAGHVNAFGSSAITVKSGATLNKGGFSIANTVVVEPGGIVVP